MNLLAGRDQASHQCRSKAPHPSPLPEGEGTDRVGCEGYVDTKYRVECKFQNQRRSAPSPSGEGWGEGPGHYKSKAERTLLTTNLPILKKPHNPDLQSANPHS